MKKLWLACKEWLSSVLKRNPPFVDLTIQIQSVQRYGTYNVLVTDINNRSYDIGVGAFLGGTISVPKGRWQEMVDSIYAGDVLNIRVRGEDLSDTGITAISVLRVNGIGRG